MTLLHEYRHFRHYVIGPSPLTKTPHPIGSPVVLPDGGEARQASHATGTGVFSSGRKPLRRNDENDENRGFIDVDRLKDGVDLLTLIEPYTVLRPKSSNAKEHGGACPWCGGDDRFVVWPATGRWWCRRCDRRGDAIAFVQQIENVRFREACDRLARATGSGSLPLTQAGAKPSRRPRPPVPETLADRPDVAEEIVARCEHTLAVRSDAMDWLAQRGLHADTVRAHRLGWSEGLKVAGAWVPRGWTLPWILDGVIDAITVRRPDGSDPKYEAVTGSRRSLYLGDTLRDRAVAVLTEGEFDALLLSQEAGDLVGVASLGSAGDRLRPAALPYLVGVPRIFISYDDDPAGQAGAAKLAGQSDRFAVLPVPGGDLTDYHCRGSNLADFICGALGITGFAPDGSPTFSPLESAT